MLENTTIYLLMSKFLMGALIFIRILGFMASAPFFKNSAIIPQHKVIFSAIFAMIITTSYWTEQPVIDFHLWFLVLLVFKEFLVGIIIGFAANAVFFAARFAGGLIDLEMGYQTAVIFDQNQTTPTLIGEFQELIVLMIFLFLDGHLQLIEAAFASFRAIPVSTFEMSGSTVTLLLKFATTVLILGVKMAAPVLVALFCTNLALALLARVAPQTNIFILSFQMKVVVGLLILSVSMPVFIYLSKWALSNIQEETMRMILSLNPGRI